VAKWVEWSGVMVLKKLGIFWVGFFFWGGEGGSRFVVGGAELTVTGEIGFSPKINVFKLNSRFWIH
jgi:hypothetical protein